MPELPEVNTVMKIFREQALEKRIKQVDVFDDYILKNRASEEFIELLTDNQFMDTYRQGKYFFGILKSNQSVLFHLGMTGDMVYYAEPEDRPKHERFNITFNDNLILGYNDPRKFSNILVLDSHKKYLEDIQLGPDALSISKAKFLDSIQSKKAFLKGFLLNQKLIAGIGNLYADEICFQSKIHPSSRIENLSKKHCEVLYQNMKKILKLAVRKNAYYQVYPEDWFWKWRKEGASERNEAWTVKKMTVAGRTTFWVEGYQEMY